MAKVTLEVLEGDLSTRVFSFTEPEICIIGRAKDCRIQLVGYANQQYISRYHCELEVDPPHIRVRDLQSKNGTCVKGRKIAEQFVEVGDGDEIALGRTVVFRVHIEPVSLAHAEVPTRLQRVPGATQVIAQGTRQIARGPWQSVMGGRKSPTLAPSFSLQYFGFRRKPFQGSGLDFLRAYPDYDSTYIHLLDVLQTGEGRLIALIGPAGTGKTLILRNLVQDPTVGLHAVLCQAPKDYDHLLTVLCAELNLTTAGAERPHKIAALVNYVKTHQSERLVVIIDDAEGLDGGSLSNIFGLSRLGVAGRIVLAGSHAFKQNLQTLKEEKNQGVDGAYSALKDNIEIELKPMDPVQVATFIRQQLHIAGGQNESLFSKPTMDRIARYSQGIPGLVNMLCDRALLLTEEAEATQVSAGAVDLAASQLALVGSAQEAADDELGAALSASDEGRPLRRASYGRRRARKGSGLLKVVLSLLLLAGVSGSVIYSRYGEIQLPGWMTDVLPNQLKQWLVSITSSESSSTLPPTETTPEPAQNKTASVAETAPRAPSKTTPAETTPGALAKTTPTETTPGAPAKTMSVETTPTIKSNTTVLVANALRRGRQQLDRGEIAAARSSYQKAADKGNASAMLALGETYDPVMLQARGISMALHGDPTKAAQWYLAAFRGGESRAATRLTALRSWMASTSETQATQ